VEPKTEIQVEQVHGVFRVPRASSYEDANIVVIKASPVHLAYAPCLLILILALCSIMIVH
jgi:hypothetical protein